MNKLSTKPCPICGELGIIIGKDDKNKSIASCGCKFRFKKTRSQKMMDRMYVVTPWGLEKVSEDS